jgi:hypothetical protein
MYLSTLTLLIFVVLHYYAADGLVLPSKFPALVPAQDQSSPLALLSRRRIFGTIVAGVLTTVMVPPSPSVADDEKSNVYADEMIMPTENNANTSQSVSNLTKQPISSLLFFFSRPRRLAKSEIHRIKSFLWGSYLI